MHRCLKRPRGKSPPPQHIDMAKYWVAVASKDHVNLGARDGFMQVCHGKQAPLKRIHAHDWVVYYSPKASMAGIEKCQAFTAIGKVKDDIVYQHAMSTDFVPFRRNVEFQRCREIPIAPLIDMLSFIRNKKSWGYVFRFGLLEIPQQDFDLIRSQMLTHEISR